MTTGARDLNNGSSSFTVWAPELDTMVLHIVHPLQQEYPMQKDEQGYFSLTVEGVSAGTKYFYKPAGGKDLPDPASHYQPDGVHGASEVVDHHAYEWNDAAWRGLPLKEIILYEVHVGTFTTEGTFEAIIPRLDALVDLGINAIELMPVSQFPGNRNWGYDGVYPYAVQNTYGGPFGLKKLVDACHQKGIAVFLDVVYNHLGPEGNYLSQYGPYFTSHYNTPWGDAINFDREWSDGVREYFSENVIHWFELYHIDGLRCDAIHTVYDSGAIHFWELCYDKIKDAEARVGRRLYMTAESDLNTPRVAYKPELGGYGFDAQWLDDFHHALYVILDEKGKERYEDFGRMEQLAKAYTDGFVHSGDNVKFRKRKHGRSSAGVPGDKFIVFNQNHDQIGNRAKAERLCLLVNPQRQKLAAAAILLAPYVPLIFMGEEYSEEAPFYYFVSHSDPDLIKAVQEGRKEEFAKLNRETEPPDPQDENTFLQSKLQWNKRNEGQHQLVLNWFKQLIELRKTHEVLKNFNKNNVRVTLFGEAGLVLYRQNSEGNIHLACIFNFAEKETTYTCSDLCEAWQLLLHSNQAEWSEQSKENNITTIPENVKATQTITIPALTLIVYSSQQR